MNIKDFIKALAENDHIVVIFHYVIVYHIYWCNPKIGGFPVHFPPNSHFVFNVTTISVHYPLYLFC